MKKLDLLDLEFGLTDYKEKAPSVREWLIALIEINGMTIVQVAREADICKASVYFLINGRSKSLSYKNMNKLRNLIKKYMKPEVEIAASMINEDECFEG